MSSSNQKGSKKSKPKEEQDSNNNGDDIKFNQQNNLLVDHTYTDYAIISEEDDIRLLEDEEPELSQPTSEKEAEVRAKLRGMVRKNAGGVTQPFPGKLMEVLNRPDLAEIIEWMPHGRSFLVKQPKTFASQVLPRFFKQTKFLSFTRQLNLWGFKRITRGKDQGAYYHEIFLRGRPHLAMRMKRQKIKGTGMKLTPDPDREPDFYNDYPMMPPLKRSESPLPPLPPLPMEQMEFLQQTAVQAAAVGGIDSSNDSMLNTLTALKVASSQQRHQVDQQQQKMPPKILTHTQMLTRPQLQQIHQQSMAGMGGHHHIPNNEYQNFFGAMNAGGMNSVFSSETLQQIQQQQQQLAAQHQQLQHQMGNHHHRHQPTIGTTNSDFQQLYGAAMNRHQTGMNMNSMLAAASQLPSMGSSAMLPSNQLTQAAAAGSHIAKRAFDDVLVAPGVRAQLGLNAATTGLNGTAGSAAGGVSTATTGMGIKDELSAVFRNFNNGVLNNSAAAAAASLGALSNNYPPLPPLPQLDQTAMAQDLLKAKAKDDLADPSSTTTTAATTTTTTTTDVTAAPSKEKTKSPSPSTKGSGDVFAGSGNDPLQDALKKVGNDPLLDALKRVPKKLDDDAASLQRAKAKILQSLTSGGGADHTDNDNNGDDHLASPEEKKSGGDSPPTASNNVDSDKRPERRHSLGRPFGGRGDD